LTQYQKGPSSKSSFSRVTSHILAEENKFTLLTVWQVSTKNAIITIQFFCLKNLLGIICTFFSLTGGQEKCNYHNLYFCLKNLLGIIRTFCSLTGEHEKCNYHDSIFLFEKPFRNNLYLLQSDRHARKVQLSQFIFRVWNIF